MINKNEQVSIIINMIENMDFHISHVTSSIENGDVVDPESGKDQVNLQNELEMYQSKKSYLESLLKTFQGTE